MEEKAGNCLYVSIIQLKATSSSSTDVTSLVAVTMDTFPAINEILYSYICDLQTL
jgi:hypothetical protein